jgi:hypothetical protein
MVIDPTLEFALVELERIKWFLGNIDLTKNEAAGCAIQDAYTSVIKAIAALRRSQR